MQFIFIGGGNPGGGGASAFLWNGTGLLSGFFAQAGTFDGMLTNNPALAGDGPFDGQRVAEAPRTMSQLVAVQRVPSNVVENTLVEFYRIRAGVVLSLGVVTITNTSQFELALVAPAATDILTGDIFFVSLAAPLAGATPADLTCFLRLA